MTVWHRLDPCEHNRGVVYGETVEFSMEGVSITNR
jgi:hypothetical protein